MIDYAHIKESFPKAFDTLRVWYEDRGEEISIDTDGELCSWLNKARGYQQALNRRDLYDFFDEKGLYCGCILDEYGMIFFIRVVQNGSTKNVNTINGKDRHEAESAGFTKAFEILEKKLKQ